MSKNTNDSIKFSPIETLAAIALMFTLRNMLSASAEVACWQRGHLAEQHQNYAGGDTAHEEELDALDRLWNAPLAASLHRRNHGHRLNSVSDDCM